MSVKEFIEHHNGLIIGEEPTSFYQLCHSASGETWETLISPTEEATVNAALSNVALGLPTGQHALKLQAVGANAGTIRGQMMVTVEGKSAAARKSSEDAMTHAKATAMNVRTAEGQLNTMSARLQEAEERARQAEERAGNMMLDHYKGMDIMHSMIMSSEETKLNREERQARIEGFQKIAETLTPIVGQALVVGSMFVEHKVKAWQRQWAREEEEAVKAEATKANANGSKPSSPSDEHTTEGETVN